MLINKNKNNEKGKKMAAFRHISELLDEILPKIIPQNPQDKKVDKIEEPQEKEEVLTEE